MAGLFIMRKLIFLLVCPVCLLLSGCALIIYESYGMKLPKMLNKHQILSCAGKYDIPADQVYILDTSYSKYLKTLPVFDSAMIADTAHKWAYHVRHNHGQPLQALYFDRENKLVSFHINCDIKGFPNLNWNYSGNFNTFIPKTTTYIYPLVTFDKILPYIRTIDDQPLNPEAFKDKDFNIVVFWGRISGRQSKRLVRTVRENLKLANDQRYNILYVNDDNIQSRDFFR
jgi:hypothetical protein